MKNRLCHLFPLIALLLAVIAPSGRTEELLKNENGTTLAVDLDKTTEMETEPAKQTTLAPEEVTKTKPMVKANSTISPKPAALKPPSVEKKSGESKEKPVVKKSEKDDVSVAVDEKPKNESSVKMVETTAAPPQTAASTAPRKDADGEESLQDLQPEHPEVEGEKAEPAASKVSVQPEPPVELPEEGRAKEDLEPAREGNDVQQMVEEAKGNGQAGKKEEGQVSEQRPAGIKFDEPEDSNFLFFLFIAMLLVACIYLLQHNKKRILGLMFEGRGAGGRRNVRYRRLSQRDDPEAIHEDILY